ncbi:phosphate ABC transporter permease PstC, partial [bacterium]|nr:phosphate ABC transporter permease PstC [bacterium]
MKGDRVFLYILRFAAGVSLLILAAFFVQLLWSAWPAFRAMGLSFFVTNDWDPNQEHFGAGAFIYGTVVSSILALIIAIPVSVATALCLTEVFSSRIASVISFFVE